jgi:hypothetical protein
MARADPVPLRYGPARMGRRGAPVGGGVTYGWGMVPVEIRLGRSRWRTALFPKDGGYVLPLRDSVCNKEEIELNDVVHVRLVVRAG